MKRIGYGDSWWLCGDSAAETVLEYAVVLAKHESAASVDLNVLDVAGTRQVVSLLIGPATMMTAETTVSALPEPDNTGEIAIIRDEIRAILSPPPTAVGTPEPAPRSYFDDM
jgi:hypothetical protein